MNAFQFPVQKNMINAVLILQLVYTSFALTIVQQHSCLKFPVFIACFSQKPSTADIYISFSYLLYLYRNNNNTIYYHILGYVWHDK